MSLTLLIHNVNIIDGIDEINLLTHIVTHDIKERKKRKKKD